MCRRWSVSLGWLIALLLIGALIAPMARAQDATPAGTGETITSITREEFYQKLRENFQFEEPASTGGQLIMGSATDIDTVNGLLVDDSPTSYINGLMFESLVGADPFDGTIVPGLADRYEIAPDGVTYTFFLNEDAKWHDGTDFTAEDVAFSFEFALAPDTVYAYTTDVDNALKSVEVIDENTVQLVSEDVLASFLYDAPGTVTIMPKHIWESVPFADWPTDPGSTGQDPARVIGTGPFKFQEWVQEESTTLVRNDEYWDPEAIPVIDEFIFRILPDDNASVQALMAGEIDIMERLPPAQVQDVVDGENTDARIYDTLAFNRYTLNQEDPKFAEVAVRQAMLYALDRQLIAEEIYEGYAEQANGTQATLSWSYAPDRINTIYNYDPDKARQLLEEAGWTDSDEDGTVDKDLNGDGAITEDEQLRFDLIFTEGAAVYDTQIPYMQEAWAEVGIDALPQAIPFPTLQDRIDTGEFDAAVWGFGWDPDGGQGSMFRCDSWPPNGFNSGRYCNPAYDELDSEMMRTLDNEARRELQIELSNIANDDAAEGIIVFRQDMDGFTTRVHNFYPTGYGFVWSIPFVWVDEA